MAAKKPAAERPLTGLRALAALPPQADPMMEKKRRDARKTIWVSDRQRERAARAAAAASRKGDA